MGLIIVSQKIKIIGSYSIFLCLEICLPVEKKIKSKERLGN